ncbi:MAG: hypothetical protein IKB64_01395 [Paludibacteraceae bacterium]|nr:hypothetical protein [Paludibacteraceae bacterium]
MQESSREEKIAALRKAYRDLDEKDRKTEIERLYRIINHKPILVLEDYEKGKLIKFLDIGNLQEYLYQEKGVSPDRSFLYKVLTGRYKSAYGFKIYYQYEEEL